MVNYKKTNVLYNVNFYLFANKKAPPKLSALGVQKAYVLSQSSFFELENDLVDVEYDKEENKCSSE